MEDDFTKFAEVWIKLTTDWERILTFHRMGMLGLETATAKVHASNVQFVQQLVSGDFNHLLKNPDAFVREGHDSTLIKAMTEGAVGNFEESLDAAALVFAHSILDSAVHDCLWISAFSAPRDGMEFVGKRSIPLSELETKSPAEHLKAAVSSELDRLERESLLKKVDRLFQLCKPKKQTYLTNGFRFDRDRLQRLDALRHAIVHAPGMRRQFAELADDLEFLRKSGLHLLVMLSETYVAGLNTQELLAAYQRRNSSMQAREWIEPTK
jgi:hypothetical protein